MPVPSERQAQLLDLLMEGLSNKQIAGRLALSLAAVEYYITHLLRGTQTANRVELAIWWRDRREYFERLNE